VVLQKSIKEKLTDDDDDGRIMMAIERKKQHTHTHTHTTKQKQKNKIIRTHGNRIRFTNIFFSFAAL